MSKNEELQSVVLYVKVMVCHYLGEIICILSGLRKEITFHFSVQNIALLKAECFLSSIPKAV